MKIKISVIMSVYNQEKYVKEAIESILKQTFKDFEFLIIDDKSTDDSLAIIKSFRDKRIKLFYNKSRLGLSKCLNLLISRAKGVYIARMDGDDISFASRLEKQAAFLNKNPQVVLVGSWATIINKLGQKVGKLQYPTDYKDIKKSILLYNPFIHPSVCFRKDILQKTGKYNEQLFYSQDYDLFLRLAVKYPCFNIPEYLLKFRWLANYNKQKEQHRIALQIRLKAIKSYGYQWWELVKLIKPGLLYFVPIRIKRFYWNKKFNE